MMTIVTQAQRLWRNGAARTRPPARAAGNATSTLRHRAVKASLFIFAQQGLSSVMRLGGSLLLTRLLPPEAFGLMSVAYVVSSGLALLSDLGLAQNVLVNGRGDDPRFLQTAWTLQVLRSVLICMASLACTAMIFVLAEADWFRAGTVYHHPDLPLILSAFSLTVLVSGLESIRLRQAQRRLQLGWVTGLELGSQALALVAMIAVAAIYHSVWALVVGAAVSGLAKTIGSHLVLSGVPARFAWHRPSASDLLHFGKWILVSSALTFFVQSGDRLILGGVVDAALLGSYSIAVILIGVVQALYLGVVSGVMLPALSEAARDGEGRARTLLSQFQLQSDLFLFGVAGGLFVAGPSIIGLLYDHRYAAAGPVLSMLAIGLIGLRFAPVEQYAMMQKKTHNFAIWNAARAIAMAAGLPLGYSLDGFDGAVVAIVATQFAAWPFAIHFRLRNNLIDRSRELLGLPALAVGMLLGWGGSAILDMLAHALRG